MPVVINRGQTASKGDGAKAASAPGLASRRPSKAVVIGVVAVLAVGLLGYGAWSIFGGAPSDTQHITRPAGQSVDDDRPGAPGAGGVVLPGKKPRMSSDDDTPVGPPPMGTLSPKDRRDDHGTSKSDD